MTLPLLTFTAVAISAVPIPQRLDRELARLNVSVALVLPSPALDDSPLWSPDSRYVAGNVGGTWKRVDLTHVFLEAATWRGGQAIGILKSSSSVNLLGLAVQQKWEAQTESRHEAAQGHLDIRVEFRHEGLGTALVVTRGHLPPETLWQSDLENCGAPVVSPDGTYLAFICEMKGLLVMPLSPPGIVPPSVEFG